MDGFNSADIRGRAQAVLEAHWVEEGYTVPNPRVYPWQWLWDSCFHAICWAELGDDRGLTEIRSALSVQAPDGFVPHMNYGRQPDASVDLWGRRGASSITQPPMYGHALAELARRGVEIDEATAAQAEQGLRFLLVERERDSSGLVSLCHPWESGADDSPRWDDYCPGQFSVEAWRATKNQLVTTIEYGREYGRAEHGSVGSPVANPAFMAASVGFNALVVFNARELAEITGRTEVTDQADELSGYLANRWDWSQRTWVDGGVAEAGSGRARTLDGLLPVLVDAEPDRIDAVAVDVVDPQAYGGRFGPAGVHRGESVFDPGRYWRGPAWPQLSYLIWVGLQRHGRTEAADAVARSTVRGARESGFGEYWNPDDATTDGAVPQSWTALVMLMA